MTRKDIRQAYDTVTPTRAQKEKMLDAILSAVPKDLSDRKDVAVMKKYTRKPMVAAALITLAVLLAGCTAAAVVLGLQDLKLGEHAYAQPGETAVSWDEISLQGFVGSPGYQANKEWREFLDSYDPDGSIGTNSRFHNYEAPEEYKTFNCSTQEERDKLDEICKKYDLKLPGRGWPTQDIQYVYEAVGIQDVLSENNKAIVHLDYGYVNEDGSFCAEGGAQFPGQRVGDMLAVSCNRKGYFDTGTESVTNVDDFDQWTYTTKDGAEVLLAVTGEEVVMIADRDDFFMSVRLYGEGCSMVLDQEEKRKMAEQMADCFDFTISPKRADTSVMERATQAWDDMQAEMEENFNKDFQCKDYTWLFKKGYLIPSDGSYALTDLNGDGYEELILRWMDDSVAEIVTYDGEQTSLVAATRRMNTIYIEDGVKWWIAEGNILVNQVTYGQCQKYTCYRFENGAYNLFDFIEYHAETDQWSRSQDGDTVSEQQLSEADAKQILDSYTPMDLDFKPVTEFPMD